MSWFYFGTVGCSMGGLSANEANPLAIGAFLSISFLLVFGVWLIPTLTPVRHEFRRSGDTRLIFANLFQWTFVGLIVGGIAGFVSATLYATVAKKTNQGTPA